MRDIGYKMKKTRHTYRLRKQRGGVHRQARQRPVGNAIHYTHAHTYIPGIILAKLYLSS